MLTRTRKARGMSSVLQSSIRNKLLGEFSAADFAVLQAHLSPVVLTKDVALSEPGIGMTHCWFPERGIASVIVTSPSGRQAEVGLIGSEGMIDVSTCLGIARPRLKCFIQLEGNGYRVPVAIIRQMIHSSPAARSVLLAYVYDFLAQVSHTAFVNANLPVDARLARWLLMYHDRVDGDTLMVTHEFLSLMLGVRRAGVTTALAKLRQGLLIDLKRNAVTIVNRSALEAEAGDAYGWAEWPNVEPSGMLPVAV